jgi:ankyrin repeat protein
LDRGARIDAFCAVALGRKDILQALGPDEINTQLGVAAAHRSPLHFAMAAGNVVAVEELVRLGASLQQHTADGLSALGLAVLDGRTEIAVRLRAAGAGEDPSVRICG